MNVGKMFNDDRETKSIANGRASRVFTMNAVPNGVMDRNQWPSRAREEREGERERN